MSTLQPMLVIGLGSTGQRIVNRLRQYLFATFQNDLENIKSLIKLMVIETAHGTEIDPALQNSQILISTSREIGSSVTIDDLRKNLNILLYGMKSQ